MCSTSAFQDRLSSYQDMRPFSLIPLLIGAALALPSHSPKPFSTFNNTVIFAPPASYVLSPQVLYARSVELENGVLLATWENYSPEPPLVWFPIFRSTDGGETWSNYSQVHDLVNGWGNRYQPMLYELPARVGKYPKGTVLLAGNSIPTDLNYTKIDIYASTDKGLHWEWVSLVDSGGAALPDNGVPAIWEPFLMYYQGQIVCYYSDQRDPLHGQKLVHSVSSDLKHWGPVVDDVSYYTYTARPGMTTVTQLPNGKYMMTYEYGGGPRKDGSTSYSFPVYYRINANPLDFNQTTGIPVYTDTKEQPFGSPYVTWSPVGGVDGTIFVSSGGSPDVFVNQALGNANAWKVFTAGEPTSYSRHLRVLNSNPNHLLIMGGGILPPTTTNKVTVSVQDITQALKVAV